jgi:hypothetical protein
MFEETVDDGQRMTHDGHITTLKAPIEHVPEEKIFKELLQKLLE